MKSMNTIPGKNDPNPYSGDNRNQIKNRLGHTLVAKGLIDADTVRDALNILDYENKTKKDKREKRGLAQVLVQDFKADHHAVFGTVAAVYGFRELTLSAEDFSDERIEYIKKVYDQVSPQIQDYMLIKKIIPWHYDVNYPWKLIFIAADPTDDSFPKIGRALKVESFEVCYVRRDQIDMLLDKAFPPQNQYLKELEQSETDIVMDEIEEEELDESLIDAEINKSLLVNLVEGMLVEAVRMGASDIHIIPISSTMTEFRFRVDGMLRTWYKQEGVRPEAIAAVMKDRAKNVDRFEREAAQDGFIQRKIDGNMIRFRFSVIPIVGSEYQYKFESIVTRILDDRQVITDLDKLGFQGHAREMFMKAISKPQGMVIITGPTGSGKSTTLIAALSHIVKPEINVLTVEDPVEYIIPNVRQLKINMKMDFEKAMRAILRHDPDVVMLGEIRDKITGETAIKLANTGHLTFSTLHTNDAPSVVSRLYKMGIETFLIAYAINIVIAQRLMRKLCEKCKQPRDDLDPIIPKQLGFSEEEIEQTTFYQPVGCDHCHNGYKGRVAIHETLYFSPEIRRLIFEAKSDIDDDVIRDQAIKEGMWTLQKSACERVKQGVSSLAEVTRVVTSD